MMMNNSLKFYNNNIFFVFKVVYKHNRFYGFDISVPSFITGIKRFNFDDNISKRIYIKVSKYNSIGFNNSNKKIDIDNSVSYINLTYGLEDQRCKMIDLENRLYLYNKELGTKFEENFLEYEEEFYGRREQHYKRMDYFEDIFSEFFKPTVKKVLKDVNIIKPNTKANNILITKDLLINPRLSDHNTCMFHLLSDYIHKLFPNGRFKKSFIDKHDFIRFLSTYYLSIRPIKYYISKYVRLKMKLLRNSRFINFQSFILKIRYWNHGSIKTKLFCLHHSKKGIKYYYMLPLRRKIGLYNSFSFVGVNSRINLKWTNVDLKDRFIKLKKDKVKSNKLFTNEEMLEIINRRVNVEYEWPWEDD